MPGGPGTAGSRGTRSGAPTRAGRRSWGRRGPARPREAGSSRSAARGPGVRRRPEADTAAGTASADRKPKRRGTTTRGPHGRHGPRRPGNRRTRHDHVDHPAPRRHRRPRAAAPPASRSRSWTRSPGTVSRRRSRRPSTSRCTCRAAWTRPGSAGRSPEALHRHPRILMREARAAAGTGAATSGSSPPTPDVEVVLSRRLRAADAPSKAHRSLATVRLEVVSARGAGRPAAARPSPPIDASDGSVDWRSGHRAERRHGPLPHHQPHRPGRPGLPARPRHRRRAVRRRGTTPPPHPPTPHDAAEAPGPPRHPLHLGPARPGGATGTPEPVPRQRHARRRARPSRAGPRAPRTP